MKQKFLLLAATVLVSASASAQSQVSDLTANWVLPAAPATTSFAAEDTVYLYNVNAGGFYINHQGSTSAPYYQTAASVNDTIGTKVIFTKSNPNKDERETEDWTNSVDQTYLLTSYVTKFKEVLCTFCDGWAWTDNNTNPNRFFDIQLQGNYFQIVGNYQMNVDNGSQLAEDIWTDKPLGIYATDPDRIVKVKDLNSEDDFFDLWACVSPEDYEAYIGTAKEQIKQYGASATLRAALLSAINGNPGIDLSEQIAVYNNLGSTVAELNAAQATIAQAVVDFQATKATPENPVDFTAKIVNPTFDTVGDFHGWTGDNRGGFGAGGTTYSNAEVYGRGFDVHQDITGLPAGVYIVACNGYTRYQNAQADYDAWKAGKISETKIYLQCETFGQYFTPVMHVSEGGSLFSLSTTERSISETSVTTDEGTLYAPNTMAAADVYFHENEVNDNPSRYHNEAYGVLAEGETLRIGVYNNNATGSDWSIFDDFQLLYLGNTVEAYQKWAAQVLATAPVFDWEADGFYYGAQEREAYEAITTRVENATASSEIAEALADVDKGADAIQASVDAYAKYVATVKEAEEWLSSHADFEGKEIDMLSDYIQVEELEEALYADEYPNGILRTIIPTYDDGFGGGILSTEDILAEVDYLKSLQADAIRNALEDGTDLTELIKNPGFEIPHGGAGDGWLLDSGNGGTSSLTNWHGGNANNYCAEAYQQYFDVYQVIEGVKPGLYEVSVQAFYRTASNADAYTAYANDPEMKDEAKVHAFVYLNEFSTPVRNVMEIQFGENLASNCYATPEGTYTLNGMAAASSAFSLEDENQNFTMKAYGLVVADEGKETGTIRLGIRRLSGNTNNQSWTLWDNFKLTYRAKNVEALASVIENYVERAEALDQEAMGTPDADALNAAIATAQSANGGDAMYDALSNLVAALNAAEASIEKYETLKTKVDDLEGTLADNAETATDAALNAADDIIGEAGDVVADKNLSGADVDALIERIDQAIADLKIPALDPDASLDNPQDMDVIVNATFDTIGDFTGWSSGFGAGGTRAEGAECYDKNFDVYQDVIVPAGYYLLSVNASYRIGSATEDYEAYETYKDADVDPTLCTYLYAVGENGDTAAVAVKHCAEAAQPSGVYDSGIAAGSGLYVPNTMADFDRAFHEVEGVDMKVSVVVKVGADRKLRIGVINQDPNRRSTSWALFDDFQLQYIGQTGEQTGNATAIQNVETADAVAPQGIFTLSGQRVATMTRGLYIVNGKKVLVK